MENGKLEVLLENKLSSPSTLLHGTNQEMSNKVKKTIVFATYGSTNLTTFKQCIAMTCVKPFLQDFKNYFSVTFMILMVIFGTIRKPPQAHC